MIYFDTAYLVKCNIPEKGFEAVRELLSREKAVVSCGVARLEFAIAIQRVVRENRLPEAARATVFRLLDTDEANGIIQWLPMDTTLLATTFRELGRLPQSTYIRTLDALHPVCARENDCQVRYTNDRHMLASAPLFGVNAKNIIPT